MVINEVSKICEKKYLETNRVPVLIKLPREKYDQMFEEMKGMLRMPDREMTYGELEGGGFGWRLETIEEYNLRVYQKPRMFQLHLSTGSLTVISHTGNEIEVELEATN